MNHPLLATCFLLLPLASLARAQCIEDAFEPNNSCTQAIDLVPGSYPGLTLADQSDRFDCVAPAFGKVTIDVFYDPIGPPPIGLTTILWTSFCLGTGQPVYTSAGHRRSVYANFTSTPRAIHIWIMPMNGQTCVSYDLYVMQENELGATASCGTQLDHVCPCGNQGSEMLHGCWNSTGTGGVLEGTGQPSLSADGLRLAAIGLPPGVPTMLVQATGSTGHTGIQFGDGTLCITGSILRFPIRLAAGGSVAWGQGVAGDPPISVSGQVPGTGTRYYQVWYRDPTVFCTSDTFNLSNGVRVIWLQ